MIISKNSLKEISGRYPINVDQLKDIGGVGPKKIDSYGKDIINEVVNYVTENSINTMWVDKKRKKLIIDGETRSNSEIALDRIKSGEKLEEISEDMEISVSTILGYVTDYIIISGDESINLDINNYYNEEDEEMIIKAIDKNGIDKIQAIKKSLPDYIKYEAIRAVILKNKVLTDLA